MVQDGFEDRLPKPIWFQLDGSVAGGIGVELKVSGSMTNQR